MDKRLMKEETQSFYIMTTYFNS